MWHNQSVCVILPTYNEKDSIRQCIRDFEALGIVDRILVVNNNAADGTDEEVQSTSAEVVHEPVQGYGAAILRGLKQSTEDLVFICEPDGTFVAADAHKLLAYIDDVDVVFGSRTIQHFIWDGANMGWFLKSGNWAVAKLMEVLYNTTSLSDVGCTFRLLRRSALDALLPDLRITSNYFGPEMMLLARWKSIPFIQLPINYRPRVGQSMATGSFWKALGIGLRMIGLILSFRFLGYRR